MCPSWTQDVVTEKPPCSRFRSHITFMKVAHRSRDRPPVLMLQNPTRMFMLNPDLSWGQGNFLPLEKWVWKRGVSNCDREPFCCDSAEIRPKTQLSVGLFLHACNNSTGLTLLIGIWIHNITMSWELFPTTTLRWLVVYSHFHLYTRLSSLRYNTEHEMATNVQHSVWGTSA